MRARQFIARLAGRLRGFAGRAGGDPVRVGSRAPRSWILAAACCGLFACQSLGAALHYRDGTQRLVRGDASGAVDQLEQARGLSPDVSAIHNHLGLAYAAAGRPTAALAAFERAVALDCDNAAAQHNLELARQGQWDLLTPDMPESDASRGGAIAER